MGDHDIMNDPSVPDVTEWLIDDDDGADSDGD
jgi:hypothetical protein